MKKLIKYFLSKRIAKYYGKEITTSLGARRLMPYWVFQHFFRINKNVPWPVHWTTQIIKPEKIHKGNRNPGMSIGCYLDGRNGIEFGDNVWVGPRVSIISMNHDLNDYFSYQNEKPIKIGNNCWIATNAVILPGVELGDHVVVAAGAVVTKSFTEKDILIGGNPAKIIKKLEPYNEKESK